jgi:hypothetical protein
MRRRIDAEPGPAGDRQAVIAHLYLAHGAEKPVILAPEETLVLPAALAIATLFVVLWPAIRILPIGNPMIAQGQRSPCVQS